MANKDLTGRVALVTGGTSGLGVETVRSLALHGAEVVFTARSEEQGRRALDWFRQHVPDGGFHSCKLDLASVDSIRTAAAELRMRFDAVHLLINNAGVMNTPFGRTIDGFEMQFGVNHIGHHFLTQALLPLLRKGAPSRIVFLTSTAHLNGDVFWDDPDWRRTPYDKFRAYSSAKTANMLCAVGCDVRHAKDGIRAYGVNPGAVVTRLHRHMTEDDIAVVRRRVADRGGVHIKSISQGAASTLWAATTDVLIDRGGVYIENCGIASTHVEGLSGVKAYALDPDAADRLWALSENMTSSLRL